ncbi:MAG: hypothetical protein CMN76_00495 [Spirochaetaceae bacterium]|nr:hypothetical protein [Spirochaetaceae bacterium]|tara:strand:- start:30225 stop:30740 length:516 start_codon:yes stop_codon:yes gene_type:complete
MKRFDPTVKVRRIRQGFLLLLILLCCFVFCSGPPNRYEYRGDFPYLFVGLSCQPSMYEDSYAICPEGKPDNIVYSGWIIHSQENHDGMCGMLDRADFGMQMAMDTFINPGLDHYTFYDAAECVLAESESSLMYCEQKGKACGCQYSFRFKSGDIIGSTVQRCMEQNPGTYM